jgi:hypothetical protein
LKNEGITTIDHRCEYRKKVDKLKGEIGAIIEGFEALTPSFRKLR